MTDGKLKLSEGMLVGKDLQDFVQSFVDIAKTKGKLGEATDLIPSLKRIAQTYGDVSARDIILAAAAGIMTETAAEYTSLEDDVTPMIFPAGR